ncbi:MAG: cache domain-containing protein [Candidatus Aminicenantes bacterium]|nr:cache domain-containing protein [Candidatus Aminicenantes bacterium]
MSKQKKSIANLISSTYIAIIIVLTIILGSFFIINRCFDFYENTKNIEDEYITQQVHLIRLKLNEIINDIAYNKTLAEKRLKEKIKARVYEAHRVASKIFQQNKNSKSPEIIKEMVKETLRLLEFNNGRGYYFIKDINNNPVLYPPDRNAEDSQPTKKDPIRKYIELVKAKGEGFAAYDWYKPGQNKKKNKKVTYVKLFEPFNWIIGTGEYLDEVEKETRKSAAWRIETLKFGKQSKYSIFALQMEHHDTAYRIDKVLIPPKDSTGTDENLSDIFAGKKGNHISRELLRTINEAGEGSINIKLKDRTGKPYPKKIIYIKLYPEWNWVLGAGFYPAEFQETIIDERKRLAKDIRIEIFLIIAILGVVLLLAVIISNFFSKKIKKEFNIFAKLLKESAKKNKLLDKNQLNVAEFQELADSANQMITDKKKGEEALLSAKEIAEAATRSKSAFLANMSHEIRTPMNAIVGMSDLLYQTDITEDQVEYIDIINSSSKKMLTIINDILDFSKIEAGKFDLDAVTFNLREVVEEVSDIVAIEAHKKNLELVIFLEPDMPIELIGDPSRLHQILLNLVNNAIKFTEEGEIVISVQKEEERDNYVKLLLKVKDTGIGISVANKQKLFTSFSQIDTTTIRKKGGTGLGLAISKKLTELMKGEIGVDSREGMGSTFWFTATFEKAEAVHKKERGFLPGFKDLRILIVDDNETNRLTLRSYLRTWGSRCYCFEHGKEAIKKMQNEATRGRPFHIALLDFRMPGLSGEQIAAIIKKDAEIKDTTLILLSPCNIHKNMEELHQSGFDALLNKPVKQSQLFNCIARVMDFDHHIEQITKNRITIRTALKGKTNQLLNILLVEDNIFNQKVVIYNLRRFGHHIEIAENGKIAVEKFKKNTYDLVLMDVQMPEMDGYEATRIIRRIEKEVSVKSGDECHTPIIAMTANAMKEDEAKSLNSGMDVHLSKPFNSEKFLKTINKIINMNKSRLKTCKKKEGEDKDG